jgi:adenylate cyclase
MARREGARLGREIERKFLVRSDGWRDGNPPGERLRQGYLVAEPERSVRVRLREDGATLTLKGASRGATRAEFEYPIPGEDARQILDELCLEPLLEKTRYRVEHAGHTWEVDCFHGANEGLVVAEIELEAEEERFERPGWLGEEVTHDARYLNANLFRHPRPDRARDS